DMYRKQLWTMRQYAGYASAKESNERYRYLLAHGSTGLSMAFDLPTQLGLDSDDPRAVGEVGRTGVAIDTIDDMRTAFEDIPLDKVSTSMTINAPAAVLLALYELVGEEQGVASEQLRGTTQNDILKEYIARGNFIYPPEGAIRLTTDLFAYCKERVPKWNTISISGYHFREKGCSAVQEVGFTLANGIAYVQAALDAGLHVDDFAPRLAFFFNCHNNVFQEIAKFRAARRLWAEIMRERFGAKDERSWRLRFHTQTGGVTLTAQQPENNIVRVALQGFAAVCGGTQSLHTNGFDEALALPTERAAKIALRTQQIIGHESGAADTADPFAGSYFIESLTDEIDRGARELIAKIEALGGSIGAIDFIKSEIEESAFGYHERYRTGQDVVVGVNRFVEDDPEVPDILRVDPESERQQLERLKAFKAARDGELVSRRLEEVRETARATDNLVPVLRRALADRCSLGEVCGAMRDVLGEYRPSF
ncbi:MAG: methylmalonyl-CoA mutase family protein, partial [Actinomycetota bacterium]|nr:methylmalonyl-CoA mutase family protein [Actinomycetota bacterium]